MLLPSRLMRGLAQIGGLDPPNPVACTGLDQLVSECRTALRTTRQNPHPRLIEMAETGPPKSHRKWLLERLRGKNFAEDIVRLAQDLQVTVVAGRRRGQAAQ